jgi:hypothetical protein
MEIHYSLVYKYPDKILKDIIGLDKVRYIYEFKRPKNKKTKELDIVKKANKEAFLKEQIRIVENSDIDFSKFGWVEKVAKILNKPHQKVSSWMKRMMPEFYKEKCFERRKVALPKKYKNIEDYKNTMKQQSYERNKKYIPLIENSGIDFSKQGWIIKVAEILNKKRYHITDWMKKYMPKFYEEKCFKIIRK